MRTFTTEEVAVLEAIIHHRRDVRGNRFLPKEVSPEVLDKLLAAAVQAPSVGLSQPWEFVLIRDIVVKQQIRECFEEENARAGELFQGEKQELYRQLKLEGITEAPVNMAVFYSPSDRPVLGQTSIQEVGPYSVVCAIQNLWLMARALNVGVGWVSILQEEKVKSILHAPSQNRLIAYLCIGYVDEFLTTPELEQLGWEKRKDKTAAVFYDRYQSRLPANAEG